MSRLASGERRSVLAAVLVVIGGLGAAVHTDAAVVEIGDLFGTGAATQTSLVANGATDPHYSVVAFVSATNTGTQPGFPPYPPNASDFLGAAKAYHIDPWTPNVTTGSRVSQWIAPPGSFTTAGTPFNPQDQFVIAPVGRYVYETTFTLPASLGDLTRVAIAGTFMIDNLGLAVSLNGADLDATQFSGANFAYDTSTPLASLFVAGVNTLQFRGRNLFNTPEENDFYNPTGMQVTITSAFYESPAVPEIDPTAWPTGLMAVVVGLALLEQRRMRR